MPIDLGRASNGQLLWVTNPFTGVVTYLTDIHRKRIGFHSTEDEADVPASVLTRLRAHCPFCPGNEALTTEEVLRYPPEPNREWRIRGFYNLFPRIPEECTGGRNESYVLVETPDHFRSDASHHEHLVHSAMLSVEQFREIFRAASEIAGKAMSNPSIVSVVLRKNQGRDSGASQPHPHSQVIGGHRPFAPIARECEVLTEDPNLFEELIELARHEGFLLEERDGCYLYFSPIGKFPRCYEVVDLETRQRLDRIAPARLEIFADLVHKALVELGDTPMDYEIHADPGIPLHAHIHARHFPYSNIAGTLNLPTGLLRGRSI
jgi:galactose-1-phosphate uridylyltransferase